ncbi:MAG TPA: transcriptional repressor LexA, partial [Nitrospirota bacterium]
MKTKYSTDIRKTHDPDSALRIPRSALPSRVTERQRAIYEFIRATVDFRGIPPSMREIGEKFGIRSTNGVEGHLAALERSGLIMRERGKSRGIALRAGGRATAAVPLLGRVAAGAPVLSPENREAEVMVDLSLFSLRSPHNLFALKVRGESMKDAHIMDGDMLLVRAQTTAQNGDIIVALVEGEATVKRFFAEIGRVRLQPENSAMK